MARAGQFALIAALALCGCAYNSQERVDQTVSAIASRPYDQQPPTAAMPPQTVMPAPTWPLPNMPSPGVPLPPNFPRAAFAPPSGQDIRTVAWLEAAGPSYQPPAGPRPNPTIPPEIPGAEVPPLPPHPAAIQQDIALLYPPLPPLADEPMPVAGPNGRPFTLADFQQMAAANSPQLRQAASDVEAARGNLIQSDAYPNPTVSYQFTPSSNGSTPGLDGVGIDQTIKTGGKLGLQRAAAEMALHNAELALRKSRSDLATQVRNAYFALLVAKETIRVDRALARFTDEVYRLQAQLLAGGFAAPYEPAALRAQAYSARLAYKQSIQTYIYSWKQLVAAIGERQVPLSAVAGRVDANIPLYDFDLVHAYILRCHTDMLTARNGVEIARYHLKLAQVALVPDVDVNMAVLKDYSIAPNQVTPTLTLGVPLPVWDRNKGAIMSAEAALVRAEEEPHRVEQNLTNSLAGAYMNYKTSLDALEYYRRYILPDQVRAYRGAYERRQVDPNASFGDVVSAQQTLAAGVTTYLTTLAQVWTSVTAVADLIQTDDLFQFARPEAVPPLPGLDDLTLPCCHPSAPPPGSTMAGGSGEMLPAPGYQPPAYQQMEAR